MFRRRSFRLQPTKRTDVRRVHGALHRCRQGGHRFKPQRHVGLQLLRRHLNEQLPRTGKLELRPAVEELWNSVGIHHLQHLCGALPVLASAGTQGLSQQKGVNSFRLF